MVAVSLRENSSIEQSLHTGWITAAILVVRSFARIAGEKWFRYAEFRTIFPLICRTKTRHILYDIISMRIYFNYRIITYTKQILIFFFHCYNDKVIVKTYCIKVIVDICTKLKVKDKLKKFRWTVSNVQTNEIPFCSWGLTL